MLFAEFKPCPYNAGRERQQEKTKGSALIPVETGDKFVVDLFGEPERVFAAHEVWCQIISQGEHKDDNGARSDAGSCVGDNNPEKNSKTLKRQDRELPLSGCRPSLQVKRSMAQP